MLQRSEQFILADIRSSGRLWAFAFVAGVAAPLPEDGAPPENAAWVWSHFALSDQRSHLHLERMAEIPEAARACLLGKETRVQTGVDGAWNYGVLPDFEHELEGDESGVCRLNFAFTADRLITTRRRALQVVDGVRRDAERGALQFHVPADAIAAHVARFIDVTEARLTTLGGELDHIEDRLLSEREDVDDLRLGPIRRELSAHHRVFGALRSAFHRTLSHRSSSREGPFAERIPPLLLEIEDFDRDLAGLQDRARLLRDELESKTSAATNRSLRALTILSTLLLPPTVIVGAWGMNVKGIPFAEQSAGFWSAVILCTVVVVASYWALRQARIL